MSKEITNKEVIDKLQQYFLKQDAKVVARMLANQIIDLNRLWGIESLDKDERLSLTERMGHNLKEFHKLIRSEDGKEETLVLKVYQ